MIHPRPRRPTALLFLLLMLAALTAVGTLRAEAAETRCTPAPLIQPGKKTLPDRVLVRPGAMLTPAPDGTGGAPVPAFAALFVYGHSEDGRATQVGASSACKPDGWIATDHLVPWRNTMVAAFPSRAGRERVLFFENADTLRTILKAPDTAQEAARLQAAAAKDPQSAGIVAQEPETPVDITKQFYLLPVLEAKGGRFSGTLPVDLLHVASLTLPLPLPLPAGAQDAAGKRPDAGTPAAGTPDASARHNFRTAVVFVVDATRSMDPYLDRSRQAIGTVLSRVEKEGLTDRVRFGLVAFRDDPKAVPKIEYGTRVYADPNVVATRAAFDRAVGDLHAARVSSRAEAEDVYAGMDAALRKIDWRGFDGRFVVLVTDASARAPNSGLVTTHLDEGALATLARGNDTALLAVHLLTKEGGDDDHAVAEKQYRAMTAFPGQGSLYYQVPAGDVEAFGKQAEAIGDSLVHLIESAEDAGTTRSDVPKPPAPGPAAKQEKRDTKDVQADIAAVGYAMRMAYLGRLEKSVAPTMFDAWALSRDIAHPDVQSLDIRVLMSKAQLSDLATTVDALYGAFKAGRDDPSTVVSQLRSALVTLGRNPDKIGSGDNRNLTRDALEEYLGGLPYQSKAMKLDEDNWSREMQPGEQQDFIDHLAVDLDLYRHMQDDVSHWVRLAPNAPPEDAVYPVPVNALP